MPRLIPCRDCGAEISSSAVACPKCGRPAEADRTDDVLNLIFKVVGPFLKVAFYTLFVLCWPFMVMFDVFKWCLRILFLPCILPAKLLRKRPVEADRLG